MKRFTLLLIGAVILSIAHNGCSNKNYGQAGNYVIGNDSLGVLYPLYTTFGNFDKLPRGKIVFDFIFGSDSLLTLRAYDAYGFLARHNYALIPDFNLEKLKTCGIKYGTGTALSNVILYKSQYLRKNGDEPKADDYVVFYPQIDKKDGHVRYNIVLSKETNPANISCEVNAAMENRSDNNFLNPSPPKEYNN